MEKFGLIFTLSLVIPIIVLVVIVLVKIVTKKVLPNNQYTPFDNITGNTPVIFHEEKEVFEEDEEEGDDKEKNNLLKILN